MFIDAGLRRACAVLGIRLTHSQPGQPAGRGKIERFFRTVRDQFLVEITDGADGTGTAVGSLAELNALFTAWVEQVYHPRVHSETQMAPLARFLAAGPPAPTPAGLLTEAFRWSEWRTVTKTATVSLHGNLYEVDPALAGARVELTFDPFDLTDITVAHHGRAAGRAVPFQIGRHVHPSPHRHRTGGDPDRHRLPAPGRRPPPELPGRAAALRTTGRPHRAQRADRGKRARGRASRPPGPTTGPRWAA